MECVYVIFLLLVVAYDDTRKNYNFILVHDVSSWSATSTRESQDEKNSSLAKQEGRDF